MERHFETCCRARFDLKTLGVVADGREDQYGFRVHVHAQGVRARLVRGSADLRASETDIDVRNRFARRVVDHLAHDDGLHRLEN